MAARSRAAGRQCILDQAQLLFLARGYHGVSIRDIVQACGLSNAALYYHFGSKQNLFVEVFKRYMANNMQQLQQAGMGEGSCRARLVNMATAHARFMIESHSELHILLHDLMHFDRDEIRKLMNDAVAQVPDTFGRVLEEGIARGEVRPLDTERVSTLVLGMIRSICMPTSHAGGSVTLMEDIEMAISTLFDGIGA